MAKLSFMEEKYILRAETGAGYVTPDGKQQKQVCERLVTKGSFVRLRDGAYTTPAIAEELGLEVVASPEEQ